MKRIQTDAELMRLHEAGAGLIYNDYSGRGSTGDQYNVLHVAGCNSLAQANVNYRKFYFNSISEATEWLMINRGPEGKNWKRCDGCDLG